VYYFDIGKVRTEALSVYRENEACLILYLRRFRLHRIYTSGGTNDTSSDLWKTYVGNRVFQEHVEGSAMRLQVIISRLNAWATKETGRLANGLAW